MIVTMSDLLRHLRLSESADQTDLYAKLTQAQAMVLDYLADPTNATWTATLAAWGEPVGSPGVVVPAPAVVQAAILEQAAELYGFRGDDPDSVKRDAPGDLSPSIKAKLYRLRKPVLA
jgi:hypothetical protein